MTTDKRKTSRVFRRVPAMPVEIALEVLKLRFEEKKKFPEIAAMYGMPEDTFRYRLNLVPEYADAIKAMISHRARPEGFFKPRIEAEVAWRDALAGKRYTDHPKAQFDGGKGNQSRYANPVFSTASVSTIYG